MLLMVTHPQLLAQEHASLGVIKGSRIISPGPSTPVYQQGKLDAKEDLEVSQCELGDRSSGP